MKKVLITLIFSLIFAKCIAPTIPTTLLIQQSETVYIYGLSDPVLRAVASYESGFDPLIRNRISGARGLLQIMPIMIREVNLICKKLNLPNRYTWKDAYDPYKSIEIWYIVQNYKNPDYDLVKACKIWFGTGIQKHDGMTWKDYYKQIKKRMK